MTDKAQTAGLISILAALLVPSWWVLPQVLAGLGAVSIVAAGCAVWLERLQPVFASIAILALAYQAWLIASRPPHRRTGRMLRILWTSIGVTTIVFSTWVGLWLRYR